MTDVHQMKCHENARGRSGRWFPNLESPTERIRLIRKQVPAFHLKELEECLIGQVAIMVEGSDNMIGFGAAQWVGANMHFP